MTMTTTTTTTRPAVQWASQPPPQSFPHPSTTTHLSYADSSAAAVTLYAPGGIPAGMETNSSFDGTQGSSQLAFGSTPMTSYRSSTPSVSYGFDNFHNAAAAAAGPAFDPRKHGYLPAAAPASAPGPMAYGYAPTAAPVPVFAPDMTVAPQATLLVAPTDFLATPIAAPAGLPSAPSVPLYIDLTTTASNDDGEEGVPAAEPDNYQHAWAALDSHAAAAVAAIPEIAAQQPLAQPQAMAVEAVPAAGPAGPAVQQKRPVDAQEILNMYGWRRQPPAWSQPAEHGFLNKKDYKTMTRTKWVSTKRGSAAAIAAATQKKKTTAKTVEKTAPKDKSRSPSTKLVAAITAAKPQGVVKKTTPVAQKKETTGIEKSAAIVEKEKALQKALEELEREKEKERAERRHQPNQLAVVDGSGPVNAQPEQASIQAINGKPPRTRRDEGYGSGSGSSSSPSRYSSPTAKQPAPQTLPESLRNCGLLLPGSRRVPPAVQETAKAAEKKATSAEPADPQPADRLDVAEATEVADALMAEFAQLDGAFQQPTTIETENGSKGEKEQQDDDGPESLFEDDGLDRLFDDNNDDNDNDNDEGQRSEGKREEKAREEQPRHQQQGQQEEETNDLVVLLEQEMMLDLGPEAEPEVEVEVEVEAEAATTASEPSIEDEWSEEE